MLDCIDALEKQRSSVSRCPVLRIKPHGSLRGRRSDNSRQDHKCGSRIKIADGSKAAEGLDFDSRHIVDEGLSLDGNVLRRIGRGRRDGLLNKIQVHPKKLAEVYVDGTESVSLMQVLAKFQMIREQESLDKIDDPTRRGRYSGFDSSPHSVERKLTVSEKLLESHLCCILNTPIERNKSVVCRLRAWPDIATSIRPHKGATQDP